MRIGIYVIARDYNSYPTGRDCICPDAGSGSGLARLHPVGIHVPCQALRKVPYDQITEDAGMKDFLVRFGSVLITFAVGMTASFMITGRISRWTYLFGSDYRSCQVKRVERSGHIVWSPCDQFSQEDTR